MEALITDGFADITTVLLVVFGAAFALTGLTVAARAGIAWIRRISAK